MHATDGQFGARIRAAGMALLLCSVVVAPQTGARTRHVGAVPAPPALPLAAPWPNGPSADPTYFPIGVWLQSPANAAAYQALGINLFVGLWEGPTEEQLAGLAAAGMPTFADQNAVGLAHHDDKTLAGWLQQDEPDNAQPDGMGGYGPCIAPAEVIARYQSMRARDPTRPVLLNLGQGVAWDLDRPYIGRGSACAGLWAQYPEFVQAADIVSFDIYPVTSPYDNIQGQLWRVALGIDRLREWTKGAKPVWSVIETTHINSSTLPTPHQIRAEVWMSLVHGASGLFYFAHEWEPSFREAGLLHYPGNRDAVAALNREIHALAPVLNSPTVADGVRVDTTHAAVPVDTLVKRHGEWTYVFAVAMREADTEATFTLPPGYWGTQVEVLGEDRVLPLANGSFRDAFAGYDVHLYRVRHGTTFVLPWVGR